jgi:hypothetical protein
LANPLLREPLLPEHVKERVIVAQAQRASTSPAPGLPGGTRFVEGSETARDAPADGLDETASHRLSAVFEVTDRVWEAELVDTQLRARAYMRELRDPAEVRD